MKRCSILMSGSVALPLTMAAAQASADQPLVTVPPKALVYETTAEGVAFAPLVGRRLEEPYMAMVRLPAGLVSPPHIKSANMFGVMVSGAMVHTAVGSDPAEDVVLPKGSFYKIPAGVPHVSKCVSKVPCITFLYQDGKFDFRPIKP